MARPPRPPLARLARLAPLAAAAVCAAAAPGGGALAAASAWFEHEHGAVRLVSATTAAGASGSVDLGLQFRMRPGWKIYWRSPGDAGFPPSLDWTGSTNLASVEIAWPAPERFSVLGLETLGYSGGVVLPIAAALADPAAGLSARARLRFLTCERVCVPYETRLALALPAGPAAAAPEAAEIAAWRGRVPRSGGGGPFSVDRIEAVDGGRALVVLATAAEPFTRPDLVVEGPDGFAFGAPEVQVGGGGTVALMRTAVLAPAPAPGAPPAALAGRPVTLTLIDGERAVEHRGTADAAAARPQASPAPGGPGLLAALALAVVGGLILNLMPCVLPVLSLKLMTVLGQGGAARRSVRAGFLASAAGILSCFLGLATLAVALRAAGLAAGWGIQFQQPVFLALMIAVITLFACNMWGLFEIRLPGRVADAAGGTARGAVAEHFLTGVFATLLATPCTAPFLGTAVGFALVRGPLEIYAVFTALGAGLALPWLAVAARPALVNRLPRPGPWMVTVKRVLSVALVGTAVWLLSILWPQTGPAAGALIALLMAAVAYTIRQSAGLAGRARLASWGLVAALAAVSMAAAGSFAGRAGPPAEAARSGPWIAFDEDRLTLEVAAGGTVLVDVTADWCLTCQVNKSLVLDRGRVAALIESGEVVAMRADWTMPDERIAAYLRRFGRFGIPFNAVYAPGAPDGIALPELLTEAAVLDAVAEARGPAGAGRGVARATGAGVTGAGD